MTKGTIQGDACRMIFNHVPKTGGISLLSICRHNLAPSEISPHLTDDRVRIAPPARFEHYKLIAGHFSIPSQGRFSSERYSMTLLRDPVRRICSTYSYWRSYPQYTEMTGIAKRLSFGDFVRYLVNSPMVIHNCYAHHFGGLTLAVSGYAGDDRSLLAAAKRNLAAFDFVGITEDLERSARLLCADLGWRTPSLFPSENRSGSENVFESIDKETLALLTARNYLDSELYDYAVELFRDRNGKGAPLSRTNQFVYFPATDTLERKVTIRSVEARWIWFHDETALEITVGFEAAAELEDLVLGIAIFDAVEYSLIWGTNTEIANVELQYERGRESCAVFVVRFGPPAGKYHVTAAVQQLPRLGFQEHRLDGIASFEVTPEDSGVTGSPKLLEFRSSVIPLNGANLMADREANELRFQLRAESFATTARTDDSITSRVAALRPWFHQIDLGNGLRTKEQSAGAEPVDHPRSTWEFVKHAVPVNLAGQSVLDVGCNAGFYAIEAKRRGAARVLGIDAGSRVIRQAVLVRDVLGLDIDYRRMSVYEISPGNVGTFDVTMALGLLYHCKHLLLAVERLFLVTRGLLIIESEVLPEDEASAVRSRGLGGIVSSLHSLAYVANDSAAQESVYNWFLPSVSGLLAILTDVGFQEATLVSRFGGRALITAWNRAEPDSIRHPAFLRAQLDVLSAPDHCRPGETLYLRVLVRNTGFSRWISDAPSDRGSVRLGAHLMGPGRPTPLDCGARAVLTSDIRPGESAELLLAVIAPKELGWHELELDMVSEYISWFQDLGAGKPVSIGFQVQA